MKWIGIYFVKILITPYGCDIISAILVSTYHIYNISFYKLLNTLKYLWYLSTYIYYLYNLKICKTFLVGTKSALMEF